MKKILHYILISLTLISVLFSVLFYLKVRERKILLDKLIDVAVYVKNLENIEDIALSLSDEIFNKTRNELYLDSLNLYTRWEGTGYFNISSASSLKYEGFGFRGYSGRCGTMSRTLLNALWRLDIPARKLYLFDKGHNYEAGNHALIEFFYDKEWRVLSPSDSTYVWRTEDGKIATAEQIRSDSNLFSSIYSVNPHFVWVFDRFTNMRWDKLPNSIRNTVKFIIGEDRYHNLRTPNIYDLPRTVYLIGSLFMTSIFLGLAIITRPNPT